MGTAPHFVFSADSRFAPAIAPAAADLARIKSVLRFTVKDLAASLGVSRQAIYDWKSGSEIKAPNAAKLASLRDAADEFDRAGILPSPLLFQRKLPSGQTLLEAITTGRSGKEAATVLVGMLNDEARNRAALSARFANRRPLGESSDDSPLVETG